MVVAEWFLFYNYRNKLHVFGGRLISRKAWCDPPLVTMFVTSSFLSALMCLGSKIGQKRLYPLMWCSILRRKLFLHNIKVQFYTVLEIFLKIFSQNLDFINQVPPYTDFSTFELRTLLHIHTQPTISKHLFSPFIECLCL